VFGFGGSGPWGQDWEERKTREMMEKERGTQFDAELLDLFFDSYDGVLEIRRSAGLDVGRMLGITLAQSPRSS